MTQPPSAGNRQLDLFARSKEAANGPGRMTGGTAGVPARATGGVG